MADLGNIGTQTEILYSYSNPIWTSLVTNIYLADTVGILNTVDLLDYGTYSITGTVTINTVPSSRLVCLINKQGIIIKTTFSDPITGSFSFTNLPSYEKYTVMAVDQKNQYKPVIRINVTPE